MIFLISAPPRTGKTLFAIKKIFECLNDGRDVYTNIAGINIDGVRTISDSPEHPFDWRNLPNDSVIFYDEAQQHMSFGAKRIPKKYAHKAEEILDIGDSFDIHGHFGFDIYLITQKPNLLRSDILGFISVHYVLRRKWGQNFATIWEFGEAITTWSKSAASSALNKTQWTYPKHLYKYYKSAESHTVKSTFPKKYILFLLFPLLIFLYAYTKASDTTLFGLFPKENNETLVEKIPDSELGYMKSTVSDESKVDEELLRLQAESLGLTVAQLKDLQNPNEKNQLHAENVSKYNISDPFDYSYIQSEDRTFSGCIGNSKKGYKAYDTRGVQIADIKADTCKRLMAGDRPHTPRRVQNEYQMATKGLNYENNQVPTEKTIQQDLDKYQANNYVEPHLQAQRSANDSSFSFQ